MRLTVLPFVEIDNDLLSGPDAARAGARLTVRREAGAGRSRRLRVTNSTGGELLISRAGFAVTLPAEGQAGDWRVFLDRGACGWCGVKRLGAFHRSDLQTVVWDAAGGRALAAGFLRQRHGPNAVDILPSPGGGAIARIEAWQRIERFVIAGESLELDPLVLLEGADPSHLLERFGDLVLDHHGHSLDDVPIVGMMTWYGVRTAIDEEMVLENAAIAEEIFRGYPQKSRCTMILDHGWTHDANWGTWERDKARFPHTLRWLSDVLARRGIALGLWYTPFFLSDNCPDHAALADLRTTDEQGAPHESMAAVWGHLPNHPSKRAVATLDAARQEVQRLWKEALRAMKSWGSVYWKLDFFQLRTGDRESRRTDLGDLYERTWRTFRKAVGTRGHLAPCSAPTNLQIGYADSVRIAADIGNAGGWPGTADDYRRGLSTIAALWYKNRRFWVNDADSVQLGKGCSLGEARVRATAAALSGGHLMLSEDLRSVGLDRLELFRRLLPPVTRAARPVNLFENPHPEGMPDLWALEIDTSVGRRTTMAAFNLSDRTRTVTLEPTMLGIPPGKGFLALEWWSGRWLGRFSEAFEVEIAPFDVAVIHAAQIRSVPSILTVSHPISGPWVVRDPAFDRSTGVLSCRIELKQGLRVVLYGHTPPAWRLPGRSQFRASCNGLGGWQAEVVTTSRGTPFEIGFERAVRGRKTTP